MKLVANYISLVMWSLILISIFLSFAIPQSWYFRYDVFTASYNCGLNLNQFHAERWMLFTMKVSGVDRVYKIGNPNAVNRIEWKGTYRKGYEVSNWSSQNYLVPGDYYVVAETLELKVLGILPVFVDGPTTNVFTITESCI